MKTPTYITSTLCVLLAATTPTTTFAQAQLLPFHNPAAAQLQPQSPMSPTADLSISDVIQRSRRINIFAGFTRDIDSIAARLDGGGSSPSTSNNTVLAPTNGAIQALPRKPWEDPKEYDRLGAAAYEGAEGSGRAAENLRRFVEMHVVPRSPWAEGEKVASLGGKEVWWEMKDGTRRVQPGDIEVESVADKVSNGEIWILKGVINYE